MNTSLKAAEGVEPKYRRWQADIKISPYAAQIIKMLETDDPAP